ncbi:unnamed protein product [Coccothraustes coccothraustes]
MRTDLAPSRGAAGARPVLIRHRRHGACAGRRARVTWRRVPRLHRHTAEGKVPGLCEGGALGSSGAAAGCCEHWKSATASPGGAAPSVRRSPPALHSGGPNSQGLLTPCRMFQNTRGENQTKTERPKPSSCGNLQAQVAKEARDDYSKTIINKDRSSGGNRFCTTLLSEEAFKDSEIGLGIKVPREKHNEEVPHRLRLEGSSGKGTPGPGIRAGGRRPLGARPYQLHPLPAGSRAALGTRVFKARQKQCFTHLSASSRRQPCLGSCEPGAGSPGGGQGWRERSSRRRTRLSCAAGGAQRSAPPVRLAAESGISCLLSSLYVASSRLRRV